MTFGDFITVCVAIGVCYAFGALIGALTAGALKSFTMPVLAAMHVILFIGFVCACCDCGLGEAIEYILRLEITDVDTLVLMLPIAGIVGSFVGKTYKIVIVKREN